MSKMSYLINGMINKVEVIYSILTVQSLKLCREFKKQNISHSQICPSNRILMENLDALNKLEKVLVILVRKNAL